MGVLILALAVFGALGFLVNRGWIVLLFLVVLPMYYYGLSADWWGSGLGDGRRHGHRKPAIPAVS
jgi:hypothetical protein